MNTVAVGFFSGELGFRRPDARTEILSKMYPRKNNSHTAMIRGTPKSGAPKKTKRKTPDWSRLPNDIWTLILGKLPLEDYIRCGSVCSLCFSIFRDLKRCTSLPRTPWILLSGSTVFHRFIDMATNKMHKIRLPELLYNKILGSSEGWLVIVNLKTANLRLFNPFTRAKIQLPPTITFPLIVGAGRDHQGNIKEYYVKSRLTKNKVCKDKTSFVSNYYFRSAFLSSSECGYTVVVKYGYGYDTGLAFVRAGDKAWIDLPPISGGSQSEMFFNGSFYAIDFDRRVHFFDLSSNINPPPPPQQVAQAPPVPRVGNAPSYLGVLPGRNELLCVFWNNFRTFRLDHKSAEWVEMSSNLGGHSLFINDSYQSIACLPARFLPELVKENCIYAIKDGSVIMCNMEDREIKDYCWTPQRRGAVGLPLESAIVWVNPVLTSLSVSKISTP